MKKLLFFSALMTVGAMNAQKAAASSDAKMICLCCKDSKPIPRDPQPLIVINGKVTGTNSNLNFIGSEDIKDVSVWKGEPATAEYGEAAKGGVIKINLKDNVELLGWDELVKKYQLDPTQQLVVDKQLIKDKATLIISPSKIQKVETLTESPFAEPAIPHLKDEKIVYVTLKS